jgi:hypothetical protein
MAVNAGFRIVREIRKCIGDVEQIKGQSEKDSEQHSHSRSPLIGRNDQPDETFHISEWLMVQ